ncbi:MAG TPA: hypothetical protein GXX69_02450 [Firmicutes bacterium]|nr:hypothetical protein [Bacillota bacterium]
MLSLVCMLIALLILVSLVSGCASEESAKIAYISANENSRYQTTFSELNLGLVRDYRLVLPNADKSWVRIWVDGYHDGEKMGTSPLAELSCGLHPEKNSEGSMGIGIIRTGKKEYVFLYAPGVSMGPMELDVPLIDSGMSGWKYAIGNEQIGIEAGKTVVLGAYRHAEQAMRTYDLQDESSIEEMIKEDKTVLLLKIRVDEQAEPPRT